MSNEEIVTLIGKIEEALSNIYTKGQDSFFMVASLNSLREVKKALQGKEE